MKKTLLNMFTIAAFFAVFGCVSIFAQQPPNSGGNPGTEVSVDSNEVIEAGNFALDTEAKRSKQNMTLESIMTAKEDNRNEGTIYYLCLEIHFPSTGDTRYIDAGVSIRKSDGVYTLFRWTNGPNNCGKK